MDIGAAEIRKWHVDSNGWADIGYHYVIRRNGIIETGRDLDRDGDVLEEVGAHVAGHNARTVGICMVGGVDKDGKPANNFYPIQFQSLAFLIPLVKTLWPSQSETWVKGHRDLFPGKACPSFDVSRWIAAGMPTEWIGQA